MAYVTRALRQKAHADRQEELHPEWAAQRIRRREIAEQAVKEREARYPVLTADNADEAIEWQATRITELEALDSTLNRS